MKQAPLAVMLKMAKKIPVVDKILDKYTNPAHLLLANNPDTSKKLDQIKDSSEKERSSIFGEVFESILNRYFPNISKGMDALGAVGIIDQDPEAVPWQNEFESLTAFSMFVPDSMLRPITDLVKNNPLFTAILKNWPAIDEELENKVLNEDNPDDVINALRIIHQDIVSGKLTSTEIIQMII